MPSFRQNPEKFDNLIEQLAAASQQIFAATRLMASEVIMHPDIVKKLIQDGILPPFKTPLQEFTEQVWED